VGIPAAGISVDEIKQAVADHFRLDVAALDGRVGQRHERRARYAAAVLCAELTGWTEEAVGAALGRTRHLVPQSQHAIEGLGPEWHEAHMVPICRALWDPTRRGRVVAGGPADPAYEARALAVAIAAIEDATTPDSDPAWIAAAADVREEALERLAVAIDRRSKYSRWADDPLAHEAVARRGGMILDEIGGYFDVSRERVRQMEESALKRLRTRLRRLGAQEPLSDFGGHGRGESTWEAIESHAMGNDGWRWTG
jgi:hypothetical protein